mmetsp:Transcript_991/g.2886  ORF Transcript_991/g.2886 Transcript_991/m.2886 type:complete len:292 (-) Transcript_991:416-1291(-)
MSSQVTDGTVAKPSRLALGCTLPTASMKSSIFTNTGASCAGVSGSWRLRRASLARVRLARPDSAASPGLAASILVSSEKTRFTATTAASLASALRSAPTKPGVMWAMASKSKSPSSRIPAVMHLRMCARASASGMPMAISRSKRPARRKAGSSESGRLVAPMTSTVGLVDPSSALPLFSPEPASTRRESMHVRSWATMRRSIPRLLVSRFPVIASISSMKMMDGAAAWADSNSRRTFSSLSPDMPETISGADTLKNATFISPAIARASIVLPQPGGPWSRMPRGGSMPRCR